MRVVIGIVGMAVLFGIYTMLRPREDACTGHCQGCTGDGTCETNGARR
jgi:hypothetical protein